MTQTTIAVLDDHFLIANSIQHILSGHTDTYRFLGGFESSSAFMEFAQQEQVPDILLLDINLNGEDGVELSKKFKSALKGMAIIFLTGLTQPAIVKTAMRSGALGFMLKNISKNDLLEGLETVKAGTQYIHRDIQNLIVADALYQHKSTDYIPKFTRREREIMELLMQEKTTQEIADTLFISVNTVESHRASLLQKTGAKNIAGLVKVCIERGLLQN
jgi:DNA-binding NarL/FixJ family response regulator